MRTRLKGAVQRCAAREIAGFIERMDFRVWRPRPLVIPLPHNRAVFAHDNRADHRIRAGGAPAPLRKVKGAIHVLEIYHFVSKSAST